MKKAKTYPKIMFPFLFSIMFLFTAFPFSVQAKSDMASSIGFSVHAVLPENQVPSSSSYFDLRMSPGQTQELTVEVENETDTALNVDLSNISASTNQNGVIDYKTPNIQDSSLKTPFSTISALSKKNLTVPQTAFCHSP